MPKASRSGNQGDPKRPCWVLATQEPGNVPKTRWGQQPRLRTFFALACAIAAYALLVALAIRLVAQPDLTPAQHWLARQLMTIAAAVFTDALSRWLRISSHFWRLMADAAAGVCMYALTVILASSSLPPRFPALATASAYQIDGIVLSRGAPLGRAEVKLPHDLSPLADDGGRFYASLPAGEPVRSIDVAIQEAHFHVELSKPVTGPSHVTLCLDDLTGSVEPAGVAP